MDLLNMLLGSMTCPDSVNAVAKKTGATTDQASKLIASSLPLLLNSMTTNANKTDGAKSLAEALSQHTSTGTIVQQIEDADEEDGEKIVRHIFGAQSENVIQALQQETALSADQVTRGLTSLAPALLSVLSAAMKLFSQSGAGGEVDLSSLFGIFGGSQQNASAGMDLLGNLLGGGQTQGSGFGNILGGLFGSSSQNQSGISLGGFLGGSSQNQQGSFMGNMLGGLFGGDNSQNQQQNTGSYDGSQLMSLLTTFLK